MSFIATHYKTSLIPEDLSPILRENRKSAKYHNLFMEVAQALPSKVLFDLCRQLSDLDKQTLYISALARKVNDGDPHAFRYLCTVASEKERNNELRYSALASLRMMPEKKMTKLRKVATQTMNGIMHNHYSSHELKQTAHSLMEHWRQGER